jgi:hypothetical protein
MHEIFEKESTAEWARIFGEMKPEIGAPDSGKKIPYPC